VSSDPHPAEEVVREANRRRLFRVAVAYPAGSFALLELTHVLIQLGVLSPNAWRVVLGAAVLGFPLAMALTWDFDITRHGVVRTPEEPPPDPQPELPLWRWLAFVVVSLATGVLLRSLR
jgi:hypothetical protein